MGDKTRISWADATWNVVTGCHPVSEGCRNCYAKRDWPRLAANPTTLYYGRDFTDVGCHPSRLDQPRRWTRPRIIFVNSMSDLFHSHVSDDFIAVVFNAMRAADHHTYLILTKRPERMREWIEWYISRSGYESVEPFETAYRHVWLGVSAEDQTTAEERIPLLLATRAAVRWVSAEPLLAPLDVSRWLYRLPEDDDGAPYLGSLDWVVAGGESGPAARPMYPGFIRDLRDQCAETGTAFYFKQWGEYGISAVPGITAGFGRIGKRVAGRVLDGQIHDAYPGGGRPCQ